MLSKKAAALARLTALNQKILCPYCHNVLSLVGTSLICVNRHTYTITKQGYVNLAPQHQETHYTKSLFQNRHTLMHHNAFYGAFTTQWLTWLSDFNPDPFRLVVDLGCGEGTHISHFLSTLNDRPLAIGLDLAKEGIQIAARYYTEALWMVADLSHIPLANQSTSLALSVLSPSNYAEVHRILSDDGLMLKVIPGPNYLHEIRQKVRPPEALYHRPMDTIKRFESAFDHVKQYSYTQNVSLSKDATQALYQMTPLTWHVSEEKKQEILNLDHVTVDLITLIGRKPNR